MANPLKILIQSTMPFTENDWHVGRFSLLRQHLSSIRSNDGNALYDVWVRDREPDEDGNDPLLTKADELDLDEIWLMAADSGNGLTHAECEGLTRFRKRGGGIVSMRDHMDLGSSLCSIVGIGQANFFHSTNPDPDEARRRRDDIETDHIDFPNYHSGRNGDHQTIEAAVEHPLLRRADGSAIQYFPAHPHEGAVGAPPDDPSAKVIAYGRSKVSGAAFNLVVAFERSTDDDGNQPGRAAVHSSFHHFADYNWDTSVGCPDFVTESPGDGFSRDPEALNDIKTYVGNLADWLAPDNR